MLPLGPARLHLAEWGEASATAVACVHGVTAHSGFFTSVAETALSREFHLLAPDLRGHGRSPWEPPWSIEQHVADLRATIPPDVRLWVGHSFGGRVVLELAARHPERVDRVVLVDPALWVPGDRALPRADAIVAEPEYASGEAWFEARDDLDLFDATARAAAIRDLHGHRYSRPAAVTAFSELAVPPSTSVAPPLLVVRALRSEVCPPILLDLFRAGAGPSLDLTVVEVDVGHNVMWHAPEAVADAIRSHFAPTAGETPAVGKSSS